MEKIRLEPSVYRDKVLACWLGKNIGGTLGTPHEGKKYTHNLTFYEPVPQEPLANDDLDFQLVWLKMLEDKGVYPTFSDFTEYWLKYLAAHWYAEYSFCTYNLKRGLKPPIAGAFQNYWVDEMGSPIRSEIWACIAPGDPQLAAQMAWMDASLDHTGGEGRWGEMFWAAVESAAFVLQDPKTLIQIGLAMIPISCHIARVIREAIWCYDHNLEWGEARERIATIFGHHQPCNAIPNHGFAIIGLLYGKDYGDKLCKAVNCGYDTDCTGATLGSLLGIMYGTSIIPSEWRQPIGDAIVPCRQTVTTGLPQTIQELTERTEKIARAFIAQRSDVAEFGEPTELPRDLLSLLFRNEKTRNLLTFDNHAAVETSGDWEVVLHYGGDPVLYPGIKKLLEISIMQAGNLTEANLASHGAEVEVKAPLGWEVSVPVAENGRYRFELYAEEVKDRNSIEVIIKEGGRVRQVSFTLLGPGGIQAIPAATSAPEEKPA